MKRIYILLSAAVVCMCLFGGAERMAEAYSAVEKHPIDLKLEKMIEESPTATAGVAEAYEYATQEWDKLLNKNYNSLMKLLKKDEKEMLKSSQREWIKYRDLEFKFNEKYWLKFSGTMYVPFPYAYQCNFVKERALRLGYYLEDLEASR